MTATKIGFIGFGEVGYIFSKAMQKTGAEIIVYDILLDNAEKAENMIKRIEETGNKFGSLAEVIQTCDFVLSTVLTNVAGDVASVCAPYLKSGQFFIDLNSTSPSIKIEISKIIGSSGAEFVEGAILGAVGATGSQTKILTAGNKAEEAAQLLNNYGLNVSYYSSEIGKASMFKMLRSIFSKGLENIILELLIAGKRAGIEKDLWADIIDFMSQKPFENIAANWMQSHAVAHERRFYEMLQVRDTMLKIGIEPIMTAGTLSFFERSCSLDFNERFPQKPNSFMEVVEFMEKKLGEKVDDRT